MWSGGRDKDGLGCSFTMEWLDQWSVSLNFGKIDTLISNILLATICITSILYQSTQKQVLQIPISVNIERL
jgi:hypothetical protein